MTEPKIVHLPPREKNPPREPNETWDAGERLFGLEELLLHMPPIRKLHLERGRLKDLVRLYPDMKREFAAASCCRSRDRHGDDARRMELLLLPVGRSARGGLCTRDGVLPVWLCAGAHADDLSVLRRQLLGRVAAELVARCYAGKRGVLYCQSRTCAALPERERMLRENGYRDTGFRFRWNGQPAALYLRPCQSTEDITPVAQLLLRDLYGDLLTPVNARRMIQPEA